MILPNRLVGQYRRWAIGLVAVPASLAVLAAFSPAAPAAAATRPQPAPTARSHTRPHPRPAPRPHPAPHSHPAPHPAPRPRSHPAPPARPAPRIPYTLAPSTPTWIRIPAIAVSAPVKPMGLLRDGYIQVPPLVPHSNLVGWYKYSPLPGELGPSVLVGHRDSDGVAVFYLLGDLVRGDRIYIDRADGSTAIFTVTRVRNFEKSTFPSVLVYGPTDYSALRVITCGGVFNYAIGSYEQNIVVYATLTGTRKPHRRTPRVIPPAKSHALPPVRAHENAVTRYRRLAGNSAPGRPVTERGSQVIQRPLGPGIACRKAGGAAGKSGQARSDDGDHHRALTEPAGNKLEALDVCPPDVRAPAGSGADGDAVRSGKDSRADVDPAAHRGEHADDREQDRDGLLKSVRS